jgi:hypothetical protein
MTTIERIKEIETEISNLNKWLKNNTMKNGDLINGLGISLSDDGNKQRISSYWFGFSSEVELDFIKLYLKGLENSRKYLIKQAIIEVEELQSFIKKYS